MRGDDATRAMRVMRRMRARWVEEITMHAWCARTRALSPRIVVICFIHSSTDRSRVFSHAFAGCAHRRARWARRDGVGRATTRRRGDDGVREIARTWTSARIDDGGGGDAPRRRRRRRPRAGRSTRGAFESDASSIARVIRSISIDRSIGHGFSLGVATVHERSMCPSRRRIAIYVGDRGVGLGSRRGLERGGRRIVRRRRVCVGIDD